MRQFIILSHEASPTPDFSLDNLTGVGRMDLLARCVTASVLLSHGIREDVRTHLVFDDEFTIQFDGGSLRGLHPDERSTAALIRSAFEEREEAIGHIPVETSPGVSLIRRGFEPTLDAIDGTVIQLHEEGDPAVATDPPEDPVFVLSDHRDFAEKERELLDDRGASRSRVGPKALHADQAITVANNWCDTDGYTTY